MAEEEKNEPEVAPDTAEAPSESTEEPKKGKKKKIILIALLVLIIASGVGGVVFIKHHKQKEEEQSKADQESSKNEVVYHDLDEMIVNLNTQNKGVSFLKIKITLEVQGKENVDSIKKFSPKIKDAFQLYLRELRPEDMQGSVGLYKLKEELMLRINKIIYPASINDILFKDVLVQ